MRDVSYCDLLPRPPPASRDHEIDAEHKRAARTRSTINCAISFSSRRCAALWPPFNVLTQITLLIKFERVKRLMDNDINNSSYIRNNLFGRSNVALRTESANVYLYHLRSTRRKKTTIMVASSPINPLSAHVAFGPLRGGQEIYGELGF